MGKKFSVFELMCVCVYIYKMLKCHLFPTSSKNSSIWSMNELWHHKYTNTSMFLCVFAIV